jgi:hypothetical protein
MPPIAEQLFESKAKDLMALAIKLSKDKGAAEKEPQSVGSTSYLTHSAVVGFVAITRMLIVFSSASKDEHCRLAKAGVQEMRIPGR